MMGSMLRRSPEFDLITRYFSRQESSELALSIGDDAAVYAPPQGQSIVFSIDTQVEGRHFPVGFPADKVAARALGAAMSDLAAMGAKPHHFTLALTLPRFDEHWLSAFSKGLFALADGFGFKLVGGDTTKGPLCVSIQVHGLVEDGRYLIRSGANAGDDVYVSGTLGDAAGGLRVAQSGKGFEFLSADESFLLESFSNPLPEIDLGLGLVGCASAAIDISDGLLADLEQLCVASGLRCELQLDAIPISKSLRNVIGEEAALNLALAGGDDYKLLVALPEEKEEQARKLGLVKVGKLFECAESKPETDQRINVFKNGVHQKTPELKGFDHFE